MIVVCTICSESLSGPPFQDPSLNHHVTSTSCGHIFHEYCVLKIWEFVFWEEAQCPCCKTRINGDDNRRIKLDFKDDPEVEKLKEQFKNLSLQSGAPSLKGLAESAHATCMNCESDQHKTIDCDEYVILRILQSTENSTFIPCFSFVASTPLPGTVAKEIIQDFLTRIKWPCLDLDRNQLQMLYSYYFYNKCCWYCASPMHTDICPFVSIVASWGPRTAMNRFRKRVYDYLKI